MNTQMASKRRIHLLVTLSQLAFVLGLFPGLYALSSSGWMRNWLAEKDTENWREHKRRGVLAGPYASNLNQLNLENVYQPDFCSKKVYVLGTCNVEDFFDITQLSPSQRQRVEMLALARCDLIDLRNLVDWLRRDFGFGQKFDEHTLIILGVNSDDAGLHGDPFLRISFEASGLYDFSKDEKITTRHISEPLRWWRLMRARTANFIIRMQSLQAARPQTRPKGPDLDMSIAITPRQLAAYRQLLENLISTRATVKVVFYPLGSWFKTPRRADVRRQMMEIARQYKLDILDLTDVVPDDGFMDSTHLAMEGVKKTHPLVFPMIQSALSDAPLPSPSRAANLP
ncbi:MAG: hypothetical protein NTX50_29825 [Candidatus Sumerlaeota bacterium]|nr:hypothetical protein [Candidatus Sumerlaeota bacterium]